MHILITTAYLISNYIASQHHQVALALAFWYGYVRTQVEPSNGRAIIGSALGRHCQRLFFVCSKTDDLTILPHVCMNFRRKINWHEENL